MEKRLEEVFARATRSETDRELRVVIVYEDLNCGLRAMQLYERLTRRFAHEYRFQLDLWKCDVLGIDPMADFAADSAASADLVMVSLVGGGELSSQLKAWFDRWVGRQSVRDAALVALFNRSHDPLGPLNSAHAYLCDVAKRGRMKFLADSSEAPHDPEGSWIELAHELPTNSKPSLPGLVCHRDAYAHWGINE